MNDRQRDLFLWQWSQRRKRGLGRVTLLGALVGAIGGLVFALAMMDMPDVGTRHGLSSLLTLIERSVQWLVLSIPPFTVIGMAGAYRTFSRQELMYELLLKGGARVPEQKPILLPGDRWPLYVVIATFIVLLGLIVALWVMVGTGSASSSPAGVPARNAPPIPAPPPAPQVVVIEDRGREGRSL
ncbi:MAG: hypothetical protein Q8N51_03355, partial [Gammaproteobacteria bacterium]|nr:hypothetical protein [Gammaproteobacteria bacterium]